MAKKISFPEGNGKIENGYYDPTSIPAKHLLALSAFVY